MREIKTVQLLVAEKIEQDGEVVVRLKAEQIRLPLRRDDREELLHRLRRDAASAAAT